MEAEVVLITPRKAAQFLEANNKPGERLLNGQHRCMAVIKTGIPFKCVVVRGLDEKVFAVLDTGKTRSAKDVLSIAGIHTPASMAAQARIILLFKTGKFGHFEKKRAISNAAILDFVQSDEENLLEICRWSANVYAVFSGMSPSYVGALYYLFYKKNRTKCDEFWDSYTFGEELSANSPVKLLRDSLMLDFRHRKMRHREKAALTIMAWNAFITNQKITSLKFIEGQPFPKPL